MNITTTVLSLSGLGFLLWAWLILVKCDAVAHTTYLVLKKPVARYSVGFFSLSVGFAMLYLIEPPKETFYLHAIALMFIVSGLVTVILPTDDYNAIVKFKLDTMVNYRFMVGGLLIVVAIVAFYFSYEAYGTNLVR